ncbi:hypothetical protein GCM10010260_41930 [Streptomyces filipinensis]|uniref:Uncharacterized protein n=1 Tax=Streptomyces filipinensis TaxID=66887 RepID=A0A918MBK6_9ACTN|nr:hypothetical protein GCM10010260_41930 [Streptomyces filipinensis]
MAGGTGPAFRELSDVCHGPNGVERRTVYGTCPSDGMLVPIWTFASRVMDSTYKSLALSAAPHAKIGQGVRGGLRPSNYAPLWADSQHCLLWGVWCLLIAL